jgi:hypothetical protein
MAKVAKITCICAVGNLNTAVAARVHATGRAPAQSQIFIFKHSKMQYTNFFVICLICVQASPLLQLTKPCLCVVLLKHPECSPTSHFSHLAIWFKSTQNWIYAVSQPRVKCLFGTIAKIWQQCNSFKMLQGTRNFSLYNLLLRDSNLWRRCESCQDRNIWCYLFQMLYGTRNCKNMSSVTSRKDFTMQHCFVRKRKSMIFLSKYFNSSLIICTTIFFADKNKVNLVHLS